MLLYWIWLTTRKKLSRARILWLLERFETPEGIFRADAVEYHLAGLNAEEQETLSDKSLEAARRVLEMCGEKQIRILTYQDAAYPSRLKNISAPPVVLYYAGTLPAFDQEPVVAVVGTRKASAYGLTCAKRLGYQIGACGGIVVSGLADGCDGMAMIGAVSAGRPVVGVLGCGVDVIYPRCNRSLYADVKSRGCLISEYPPGTAPLQQNFPARNRIISGLALGVVVIEAPIKSGALITASMALEQGKDVFAVPGNINVACCAGSNHLLKEGAVMVETGWDIMQEYLHLYPERIRKSMLGEDLTASIDELRDRAEPRPSKVATESESFSAFGKKVIDNSENRAYIDVQAILPDQSEEEQAILQLLQSGALPVDELVARTSRPAGVVLSALTYLEIKGYLKRLPGNRYELARQS